MVVVAFGRFSQILDHIRARQGEMEDGPTVRPILGPYATMMGLYDGAADRKPDSHSVEFGAVER